MRKLNRNNRKGFTLVELLVVVLILAILMAVALPLYLSSVSDSSKKTCRANMQTIANAVAAYRTKTRGATYTTNLTDLSADLGSTPTCPETDGGYTIALGGASGTTAKDSNGADVNVPAGGFYVHCAHAGHNDFVPGVTSN